MAQLWFARPGHTAGERGTAGLQVFDAGAAALDLLLPVAALVLNDANATPSTRLLAPIGK